MSKGARMSNTDTRAAFLKTGETAALLGVSPNTVRAAIERGELAAIRLGTNFLVSRACVEKLLRQVGEP